MNAESTLALIQEHPMTKALLAEQAAKSLTHRQQLAEQLAELERAAAETLPELERDATAAKTALDALDKQRQNLSDKQRQASARLMGERQRIARERTAAEGELIESADPQIDEAIQFFRDEYDALRRKAVHKDSQQGPLNPLTLRRKLITRSNYQAISGALEYCRVAMHELEVMKLMPVPDAERIAELKAALPDPGEMREYSADKKLPAVAAEVDPIRRLPSESWLELQGRKLDERIKRTLGR
jgi:hypothetical protein